MSLEDQIAKLTAAIEKQNALTEQLLSKVPAATTAAEPAKATKAAATKADTPAPEPVKEEAKAPADEYAITGAEMLAKITAWIKENDKGTPEGDARRAALAETLKKLGATMVSKITEADKLSKMNKWFETKMKGQTLAKVEEPADEEL